MRIVVEILNCSTADELGPLTKPLQLVDFLVTWCMDFSYTFQNEKPIFIITDKGSLRKDSTGPFTSELSLPLV